MYSAALLARFLAPTYAGDLDRPDGTGQQGNVTCGDVVHLAVRVSDGMVTEARFRAQGCAAAIAAADAVCEAATGTSITNAQMLDIDSLSHTLGGIPAERTNCVLIGLEALRSALEQVRAKTVVAGSD